MAEEELTAISFVRLGDEGHQLRNQINQALAVITDMGFAETCPLTCTSRPPRESNMVSVNSSRVGMSMPPREMWSSKELAER